MKKYIALFLALVLVFSLAACGKKSPYFEVEIGDAIKIGEFDWRVLDIQDGKALVISDQVLMNKPYNATRGDLTWETCEIRQYLNGDFYDVTFTEEEKEWVIETTVKNENPTPDFKTDSGNDTVDRLFLLSVQEAEQYFADNAARKAANLATGKGTSDW